MVAETAEDTPDASGTGAPARPGVVVAFSGTAAMSLALPIDDGPLQIGRAEQDESLLPDERLSRNHCSIAVSPAGWVIRDLGSRNGTFVDGEPVTGEVVAMCPRVIRAANTIV